MTLSRTFKLEVSFYEITNFDTALNMTLSKLKLIEAKIEITYAANGAIFIAKAREMQYPAPPVANQNFDGPCF